MFESLISNVVGREDGIAMTSSDGEKDIDGLCDGLLLALSLGISESKKVGKFDGLFDG